MENEDIELKAQCWDIVYPTLVFYKETGGLLPPMAQADLIRAVKHFNEKEKENE